MGLLDGFHNHHIIPKYKGGNDSPDNLVLLHPIDHAIAHFVRYKLYGHPADGWAYNRIISGLKDDLCPTLKGVSRPYMKKPKSEETKAKMAASAKGRKLTQESIEKMRQSLIGRKVSEKALAALHAHRHLAWTPEAQQKKSEKTKGVARPWAKNNKSPAIEVCSAGGKSGKGRKQSQEHIAKRTASRLATLAAKRG